jgi:hypothetical protein
VAFGTCGSRRRYHGLARLAAEHVAASILASRGPSAERGMVSRGLIATYFGRVQPRFRVRLPLPFLESRSHHCLTLLRHDIDARKANEDPMTPIFGTAPVDYVSEEAMPVESGGRVWPGFRSRAPPTGLARRSGRADEEESELYPPSLVAQPLSRNPSPHQIAEVASSQMGQII